MVLGRNGDGDVSAPRHSRRSPRSPATLAAGAGCGQDSGETSVAPPPEGPERPGDRDAALLRLRRHGRPTRSLDPFRKANPDLDLKTASFNSNKAAAAKLAGGFEADVVEVCADEMEPLLVRGLIRPLDPAGIKDFDEPRLLGLRRDPQRGGKVLFAPASAGPHGLIVNTDEVDPSQIDSYADLFDPAVRRARGARVDAAHGDRRRRDGARDATTRWT